MSATSLLLAVVPLAYQMGAGLRTAPSPRVPIVSMADYRLNNYVLPGPLQPIGNNVCTLEPLSPRTRSKRPLLDHPPPPPLPIVGAH